MYEIISHLIMCEPIWKTVHFLAVYEQVYNLDDIRRMRWGLFLFLTTEFSEILCHFLEENWTQRDINEEKKKIGDE